MPTGTKSLFYGWWILAASVVIELFGLGFGIFAITTAYPYIVTAFPDWPRTVVFAPTSIIITIAACMAPLTGAFIDRFPIRLLFTAGIFCQAIGLLLFSRVATPADYVTASILVGFGLSGVTILPNQVLVSRWFRDRVGLVNGVILSATAMGAAISPALVTRIIEASDWRNGFRWIALLAFAAPLAVVATIVRDRPSDLGLEPYGASRAPDGPDAPEHGLSLREATRHATFWALAATIFLGGIPCYSFNKHILVFLREAGYAPVAAADMKSLFFFVSGCARLSFGWLCDRFDPRRLTLLHVGMIALGYPLILLVPTQPALLVPCLVVVGIGYGGLLPCIPILTVHYFGRRHLGTLLGVYKIPYDIAAAAAPLFTAWLYDRTGGYRVPETWNSTFAWIGLTIAAIGLARRSFVESTETTRPR